MLQMNKKAPLSKPSLLYICKQRPLHLIHIRWTEGFTYIPTDCASDCLTLNKENIVLLTSFQEFRNSLPQTLYLEDAVADLWTGTPSVEKGLAPTHPDMKLKTMFLDQVRLRTEVLCIQSSTQPGFELMTSRSWQYISCHWDACSNHLAISTSASCNCISMIFYYNHIQVHNWQVENLSVNWSNS